jgi:uncharacterized protein YjiS (DUF1127 family)
MLLQTTDKNEVWQLRQKSHMTMLVEILTGYLARAWNDYRKWSLRRTAIRHLQSVDEYLLQDIGIDRSDIKTAVCGRKSR